MDDPDGRDRYEWLRLRDPITGRIPDNIRAKELDFAQSLHDAESMAPNGSVPTIADHNWTLRGPSNIGGRTRALAIDVTSDNILNAGCVTGGMWRTTNGGASWKRTSLPDQLPSVTCVAQDPRNGKNNIWYFGSGEFRTNVQRFGNALYYGDGIFKSVDSGKSWSHLDATAAATTDQSIQPFNYVWNIVVDVSDTTHDVVYAAVYGGVARSIDGGASWRMVLGGNGNTSGFTNIAITSTGVVYAALSSDGTTSGLWRSADGLNWTNITPPGFPAVTRGFALGIAPTFETMVYILAETPGTGKQVPSFFTNFEYYSLWKYVYAFGNGAGAAGQWTNLSDNIPYYGQNRGDNFNGLASYALVCKVHPTDMNTVYIGGSDLYRSSDGFTTINNTRWIGGYHGDQSFNLASDLHPDQHALVFGTSSPNIIYAGCDGGVYRFDDPTAAVPTWTSASTGYITGQFYSAAVDHATAGSITVMGGLQDNGSSATDTLSPAKPWQNLFGGDGSFCAFADSEQAYVVSSQYGTIYGYIKQSNGGYVPLQVFPSGWIQNAKTLLFVNPLVLDPSNTGIIYAPYSGTIWRNTNLMSASPKDSWVGLTNSATPDSALISAISVTTVKPSHRMYIGTTTGHVYLMANANTTLGDLVNVTGANFPAKGYINCIAVDPADGNRAMVVFSNYNVQSLFYTSDAGTSWTAVGGNLEQHADGTGNGPSCRWAAVLHRGQATAWFVATSVGLFSTTGLNGANTTWVQEGATTIGSAIVSMIDVRQADGFLAVATWGNGMFSASIPVIQIGVKDAEQLPHSARLGESFPNPATSHATLPVTLDHDADVSVSLLSSDGREVADVINKKFSQGEHTIEYDIHNLSNGVYWWKLKSGGIVEMKKMALMRSH